MKKKRKNKTIRIRTRKGTKEFTTEEATAYILGKWAIVDKALNMLQRAMYCTLIANYLEERGKKEVAKKLREKADRIREKIQKLLDEHDRLFKEGE